MALRALSYASLVFLVLLSLSPPIYSETSALTFDSIMSLHGHDFEQQTAGSEEDTFVMFYAPWCGHCKNLRPIWVELAGVLSQPQSVVRLAKVDCTAETDLCVDQNIRGYPTLMYYKASEDGTGTRFKGSRSLEKLIEFVTTQSGQKDLSAGGAALDDGVYVLTSANFHQVAGTGDVFVKFYAPWCGHCKKLKPTWHELGKQLSAESQVKIAQVDCTQEAAICNEMDVSGYPSLLYLRRGRLLQKYQGGRDLKSLSTFVRTHVKTLQPDDSQPKVDREASADVVELTEETFTEMTSLRSFTFVKFYAPWCAHCKNLAPTWASLASQYHKPASTIRIAQLDCTKYGLVCQEHQVRGYPTLMLFHTGKVVAEYDGDRTLSSLQGFISQNTPKDEL